MLNVKIIPDVCDCIQLLYFFFVGMGLCSCTMLGFLIDWAIKSSKRHLVGVMFF